MRARCNDAHHSGPGRAEGGADRMGGATVSANEQVVAA